MLSLVLLANASAATPIIATTAPGFSWSAYATATSPMTVASFLNQRVSYDLKCSATECRIYHGGFRLAARVSVSTSYSPFTVNVVIDGTDAGYLYQRTSITWTPPALSEPTGTLWLGGVSL